MDVFNYSHSKKILVMYESSEDLLLYTISPLAWPCDHLSNELDLCSRSGLTAA